MISLEKWYILPPLQKMPKNVGDLSKLIIAKDFKKLPKGLINNSPNLVTLFGIKMKTSRSTNFKFQPVKTVQSVQLILTAASTPISSNEKKKCC